MRFYTRGFIPLAESRRSGNILAFRYVLFKLLPKSIRRKPYVEHWLDCNHNFPVKRNDLKETQAMR